MIRKTESRPTTPEDRSDPGVINVASYNVHRCIGTDGRREPIRIARVIGEMEVDLVGLQEVSWLPRAEDERNHIGILARRTGLTPVVGPTMVFEDEDFGNALLTSAEILDVRHHDLSVPGREPRGAIDARLELRGLRMRCVVTHLGLGSRERDRQAGQLLELLSSSDEPLILMGDFNLWTSWSRSGRRLRRRFGNTRAPATFPARRPLLALDRIWVSPRDRLFSVEAHRSPLARVASDHLPLKGRITTARD